MATVGACAAFGAICGSATATAATMGTIAIPEMKRYKYGDKLATGCVASGGSLGSLIPPSVVLIVYGSQPSSRSANSSLPGLSRGC